MFTELANINNIIITKSFEYFDNADDANIAMQLDILEQVKLEYIKLLENVKDDVIENEIIDMFVELDNNKVNYDIEINKDEITNMFKQFEDNKIDDDTDIDTDGDDTDDDDTDNNDNNDNNDNTDYNEIDDIEIDVTEKFYAYLSDEDILYETMRRSVESNGLVYYNVLKYKGEVIDTIDEYGDLYNIIKFEENAVFGEVVQARRLLNNHVNAFQEEVIPYKLKYFDFNKPLKVKVEDNDDEEDDET